MKNFIYFLAGAIFMASTTVLANSNVFTDHELFRGSWFESSALRMNQIGVINGFEDGRFEDVRFANARFAGDEYVNRAQIAAMFDRYDRYINQKLGIEVEELDYQLIDPQIQNFIDAFELPIIHDISVYNEKIGEVELFRVSYGQINDCPSGCFSSSATGMRYEGVIGWIKIHDYDNHLKMENAPMYQFNLNHTHLFSDEFWDEFKDIDKRLFYEHFIPLLAKDSNVPREALLKIAKTYEQYTNRSAEYLLERSDVQGDREILEVYANLPARFQGNTTRFQAEVDYDIHEEIRWEAQKLLDALDSEQ